MHPVLTRTVGLAVLAVVGATVSCGKERHAVEGLRPSQRGPTISEIQDQETTEDASKTVAFTVGDPDTPLAQLRLSALSSDPRVVPTNNIVFEGGGAERKALIQPAPHQYGEGTIISIKVSDGLVESNRSFRFNVWPVTKPPDMSVLHLLPSESSEPAAAANGSQPVRVQTNGTSAAADSGR